MERRAGLPNWHHTIVSPCSDPLPKYSRRSKPDPALAAYPHGFRWLPQRKIAKCHHLHLHLHLQLQLQIRAVNYF
jgi:hypothetical protein